MSESQVSGSGRAALGRFEGNSPLKAEPRNPKPNSVLEELRQTARSCYQCGRCTGGCPMAFAMNPSPRVLVRLVQLGQIEDVLSSNTPWLCATCYGCSVSCPGGIDLTALMYRLRQLSVDSGVLNESVWFYREFVANLLKRGTVYEPELLLAYALRVGLKTLLPHIGMGLRMSRQGKLAYRPRSIPEAARLEEAVSSLKRGT